MTNEEYIGIVYHNKEIKNFFDKIWFIIKNSFKRILIVTLVGEAVKLLLDNVFLSEQRIKDILSPEENKMSQDKILKIFKSNFDGMKKRIFYLIILSHIIEVAILIYVTAFINVYKYSKIDWIISSFIIILIGQTLPIIFSFAGACLRIIGLRKELELFFNLANIIVEL